MINAIFSRGRRNLTQSWLWSGRIPLGGIVYLIGESGAGKSILTLDFATRVTTGRRWPDGARCPMGNVLLLTREDDAASVIRPRLEAMAANVQNVALIQHVVSRTANAGRAITLADVDAIERAVRTVGNVRLVIVDPIYDFLPPGVDVYTAQDLGDILKPIESLAKRHQLTVLITAFVAYFSMAGWSLAECYLVRLGHRGQCFWGVNAQRRIMFTSDYRHLNVDESPLFFSIVGNPARVQWADRPGSRIVPMDDRGDWMMRGGGWMMRGDGWMMKLP
ncbi:MAG: AAA family ATPase [Thermogutta sp.]